MPDTKPQKNASGPTTAHSTADATSREAYGVTLLTSRHKDIRKLKRQHHTPALHGNKFWGSSYLLMDFLQQQPLEKNLKVLELGCGWGLAGIFCAKQFKASVTAVDADSAVFPFLHLHAEHNGVTIETQQQYFEHITSDQLAEFDVVIGADICFWDELADIVFDLIERACDADVKKIIIADPQRPPFIDMAERCVESFYGEIFEWTIDKPKRATGSLLLIENA